MGLFTTEKNKFQYAVLGIISLLATAVLTFPFSRYFVEYDTLRTPELNLHIHLLGTKLTYYWFTKLPREPLLVVIPFILIFLTCLFMFRIGAKLKNESFGYLVAGLVSFFIVSTEWIAGFNPRGIAFPVLAAFMYYFLCRNPLRMGICMILSVLFYPMVFPIMAITATLMLLDWKTNKKEVLQMSVSILISLFLLVPYLFSFPYSWGGELRTYQELMTMEEFGKEGHYPLQVWMSRDPKYIFSFEFIRTQILGRKADGQVNYPLFYFTTAPIMLLIIGRLIFRKRINIKLDVCLTLLAVLSILVNMCLKVMPVADSLAWGFLLLSMGYFAYNKEPKIPKKILFFFPVSFALFLAVYSLYPIVSLKLYFADRFLRTTMFLLLPLFAGSALNYAAINKKINAIFVCVGIVLLGFVVLDYHSRLVECKDHKIYSWLYSASPGLVAGHPEQMDCVRFFSGKEVLISQVSSVVEFKELWEEQRNKTYSSFDALYSDTYEEIATFCSEYNVTYFIIDRVYFSQDYLSRKHPYNIITFDKFIKEQGEGKDFSALVQDIPEERLHIIKEGLAVVNCSS